MVSNKFCTLLKDVKLKAGTQTGQLNWREALQPQAQQSRARRHAAAVVTVISKALVTVGADAAPDKCMRETEAEGSTDGVETETIELLNKRRAHDVSVWPLGRNFVK